MFGNVLKLTWRLGGTGSRGHGTLLEMIHRKLSENCLATSSKSAGWWPRFALGLLAVNETELISAQRPNVYPLHFK
jgi:hypothetical protein